MRAPGRPAQKGRKSVGIQVASLLRKLPSIFALGEYGLKPQYKKEPIVAFRGDRNRGLRALEYYAALVPMYLECDLRIAKGLPSWILLWILPEFGRYYRLFFKIQL